MNKRIVYTLLSAVMFISAGILLFYFFWANGYIDPPKTAPTTTYSEFTYPSLPSEVTIEPSATSSNGENTEDPYVNPVNFAELQAVNPEIVGWIYMTTPFISQPILIDLSEKDYYLSRDATGQYDRRGSLYIQSEYNNPDFEDPCTIIYGHRISDGSMLGNLQASFEDIDINENSQYVVIYLPEKTKIYYIIATITYDESHILYYNDFYSEEGFNRFFDRVYSSTGDVVQLVEDARPQFGDNVLILSTCLRTDRTRRYLVIAKEIT